MMQTMKRATGVLVAIALSAALAGCGETTDPTSQAQAPELPPVQSMQMDLSFFNAQEQAGVAETAEAQTLKLNFLNAAVRAAYVNVAVVTILAPPTLAFSAALHTIPSRDGDGYIWIYTWVDQGLDYQVRLRGTPNGEYVDWELYVVLPGQPAELWFTGQSHTQRDEGHWLFRDFTAPGDPEVLRVDWDVTDEHDAMLDLTNVQAGGEEEGDRLRYRVEGALHSIEFADASTGEDWDIIWNGADGTGSLRVPDYNNGERACWDENQFDTQCSAAAGSFLTGDFLR